MNRLAQILVDLVIEERPPNESVLSLTVDVSEFVFDRLPTRNRSRLEFGGWNFKLRVHDRPQIGKVMIHTRGGELVTTRMRLPTLLIMELSICELS